MYGFGDLSHSPQPDSGEDSVPDTCENRGCDDSATRLVKYRNPYEEVAFCLEHKDAEVARDSGKIRGIEIL